MSYRIKHEIVPVLKRQFSVTGSAHEIMVGHQVLKAAFAKASFAFAKASFHKVFVCSCHEIIQQYCYSDFVINVMKS